MGKHLKNKNKMISSLEGIDLNPFIRVEELSTGDLITWVYVKDEKLEDIILIEYKVTQISKNTVRVRPVGTPKKQAKTVSLQIIDERFLPQTYFTYANAEYDKKMRELTGRMEEFNSLLSKLKALAPYVHRGELRGILKDAELTRQYHLERRV